MGLAALGDRGIIGRIVLALEESGPPSWVSDIAMQVSSDQETETYRWLAALPALREWLGGRHSNRLESFEQTIRNRRYEATMEVLRSELRRDKTDQIELRISEMAARAQQHWAKLLTDVIEAGASTACYDGQFFFDTDHTAPAGGSAQDNDISTDVATPANPTAAEMETAIIDCIEALVGFKDEQNEPMNQDLSEVVVMTPANMFGAANAAVNNAVITDGSGTRTNNLANMAGYNVKMVVNPRLSSTTKFYVFRSDSAIKPYVAQEETTPQIEALGEGSDFAFANDAHQYGVSVSRACGQAIWQHAVLNTLA